MSRYEEFDVTSAGLTPFSRSSRTVCVERFAKRPRSGASFCSFMETLPRILAGVDIRTVVNRVAEAARGGRAVVVACGGHIVKCGLSPMLIQLMECGIITCLAVNGSVAVHDTEIALYGATSENVDNGLRNGTFGLSAEPAEFLNRAMCAARADGLGAGEALGRALEGCRPPYLNSSLIASAYRLGIPATIHVAIGTDVVHMHPTADGSAYGDASMRDFRILTAAMRNLADGGVLMNAGSAVVLPEVLLKAIGLLRNERAGFSGFLGVDCDFVRNHRASQQVVTRVREIGGDGIELTGHHEIIIPILAHGIMEAMELGATQAGSMVV